VNAIDDIHSIVGRMGNIEPVRAAMYGRMIESAGFAVLRQFDMSQESQTHPYSASFLAFT
jgi:hypothetical protein